MSAAGRKDSTQYDSVSGRKRSRAESETNNEESKKRGRPRLDSQDESAADRRKTQLRVAQRNYRQRKETTIEELRRQVKELQDDIRGMNRSFHDFSERCLAERASPSVAAGLQDLARQYSEIISRINSPVMNDPLLSPIGNPRQAGNTVQSASPIHQKPEEPTPSNNVHGSVEWSQNPSVEPVSRTLTLSNHVPKQPLPVQTQNTETFAPILAPTRFQSTTPEDEPEKPLLPRSLNGPRTYSFNERTFARRLHRASCEYAYGLACDPTRLPANFNSVFRLTLKVANIEGVKKSLRSTLDKGLREPLSNWGSTFIHVGGAGTHYPRLIEEGGPPFHSPGTGNITNVGPYKLTDPTTEEIVTAEMLLHGIPGLEGEFFDAYDVEGYLAGKGIYIDPSSSFAEIEMPEVESPTSEASPISPTASTPVYIHNASTTYSNRNMGYTTAPSDAVINQPSMNFTPAVQAYAQPNLQLPAAMPYASQAYNFGNNTVRNPTHKPRTVKATIDVGEFIKLMSVSGICLMRAPGYRRRNVDIALRRSILSTTPN